VTAQKHLSNISSSATLKTFSALTFKYVFVARKQYSNEFLLKMCDCWSQVLAGARLRSGKKVTFARFLLHPAMQKEENSQHCTALLDQLPLSLLWWLGQGKVRQREGRCSS
jgi:hypothetical protein